MIDPAEEQRRLRAEQGLPERPSLPADTRSPEQKELAREIAAILSTSEFSKKLDACRKHSAVRNLAEEFDAAIDPVRREEFPSVEELKRIFRSAVAISAEPLP